MNINLLYRLLGTGKAVWVFALPAVSWLIPSVNESHTKRLQSVLLFFTLPSRLILLSGLLLLFSSAIYYFVYFLFIV
jgi:hypothetical protein